MTERPILFSAPMVRALLDGRKTQTRRIIKPQPPTVEAVQQRSGASYHWLPPNETFPWCRPVGAVSVVRELMGREPRLDLRFSKGDRLWVRETFSFERRWVGTKPKDVPAGVPVWYWADGNPPDGDWTKPIVSIHMPRWVSRLTNIVTDVRVQRLLEIDADDAAAEGLFYVEDGPGAGFWLGDKEGTLGICGDGSIEAYAQLWEYINGAGSWDANPWVVALTFDVVNRNIDQC